MNLQIYRLTISYFSFFGNYAVQPRHNGKVERFHRKDNEYFYAAYATYAAHTFYSFNDFKKQLAVHSIKQSNFPICPLNRRSTADYVNVFLISAIF